MQRLAVLWLLCLSVFPAQELCDFEESTLLQLQGRSNRSNVTTGDKQNISLQAVPVEESHNFDDGSHVFLRASLVERIIMKARAGPTYNHGLLLVSAVWVTLLCWGELRYARWLQGRSAAFLASFSLVAANVIAKTLLLRPEFGIGVLDLIYVQCIFLSFLGVAFTKFHPDKPMVMPYDIQQGIRALSVGFFLSASSMLVLGGLSIGPATAVLLTISLHCSFATFWKQFLGEPVEPEEYLSAPLLLMAILLGTILGSVSAEGDEIAGRWMWASIFGLLGAISRTTCALQQRNTCNQMHHVVMMTYSGAIGLIMFGPIAAAYPSQARAILSLDVSNLAPLVLFGVLCLSFTLGLLKAANSVWGAMSESSYTLVAGLSLCLQFLADLIFFPVAWARFTPSSIALAASCMIFCYAVSYKQVVRAEQCFSTAYSLFEPRNFQGERQLQA